MPKISFIYFDLGGVVVDHKISLRKIADMLEIDHAVMMDFFKQHARRIDSGKITWDEFEQLLLAETKTKARLDNSFMLTFVDNFDKITQTQKFMKEVSSRYPIGILSNITEAVFDLIVQQQKIPQLPYASIVKSETLQLVKPQDEIYEYATIQAAVPKKEILFIDDSQQNVMGAKTHGWQAELFDTLNPEVSINLIREKYIV